MRLVGIKRLSRALKARSARAAKQPANALRPADGDAAVARGQRGWGRSPAQAGGLADTGLADSGLADTGLADTGIVAEAWAVAPWAVGRELSDSQLDHVNGGWSAFK
jgi:hypothetical protein